MIHTIEKHSVAAIVANSNGIQPQEEAVISSIKSRFTKLGLEILLSPALFRQNGTFNASPAERAGLLMKYFADTSVSAIFDISGGDAANQVLPYLDFTCIRENSKPFFGISDITPLLNAMYSQAGIPAYHFTARNLVSTDSSRQLERFKSQFISGGSDFNTFQYTFIRGKAMQGTIIGGNLRCFLKLAGTAYIPAPDNRILFLESLGGDPCRAGSYLAQLEQLGFFEKLNGILLGTFSHMQLKKMKPTIEEMVLELTEKYQLPVAVTKNIGHGTNSHCLVIGKDYIFEGQ